MQLINKSKDNITIAHKIEPAQTFLSRFKGLIGRSSLPHGCALWLRPCTSVHTFFMRFNIDVIFLSKQWQVVAIQKNLRPWRISKIYFKAVHVIEFSSGTITEQTIEVGDHLVMKGD